MRHLIREMRRHDLTNKKTRERKDKDNDKDKHKDTTKIFREHTQRVILETFDPGLRHVIRVMRRQNLTKKRQ